AAVGFHAKQRIADPLDRLDHFLKVEFRLERLDLRHQGVDQTLSRAIGHAGNVVDRFFRNVALASSRLAATPPSRPCDSARAALPRPPGNAALVSSRAPSERSEAIGHLLGNGWNRAKPLTLRATRAVRALNARLRACSQQF